ncbi:MAG TPA: DNA mismatch repair protein MutS [Elusimicrobia bacterium]|nr:MAG: DNA mismatch repair protein MutS [Elusimicrobia bacterium GWD2_63_28]HCC47484.1 DNA mismatch repair protein MutS [Elusimicrobiota bacterium]
MTQVETPETPLMQQYQALKSAYPHALLFFRLGDFYELFFDDARTASAQLGLTLTARQSVPMCGVPHHSASAYIARLLSAGHKVAICEQVAPSGDVKKTKLFKREVVRLITPGTVVEDELLQPRSSRYLVALDLDIVGWGLASFDASTGDFLATQNLNDPDLYQLLSFISKTGPAEILADSKTIKEINKRGLDFTPVPVTEYVRADASQPAWAAQSVWQNHKLAMKTALKVTSYVRQTQPGLKEVFAPSYYEPANRLQLDESAIKTLELVSSPDGDDSKTLWGVLDLCRTSMGSRLLRRWLLEPLTDLREIQSRQGFTAFLAEGREAREQLGDILAQVPDIERLLGRVINLSASPRDLGAVRKALTQLPRLKLLLSSAGFFECAPELASRLDAGTHALNSLRAELERALAETPPARLSDGGVIREGYSPELDELRLVRRDSQKLLTDIELKEKEKTGIPTLKVGYNSVFGYFIEVSKAQSQKVPHYFVRKQTLVNAERYITEDLKTLEDKILGAEEKMSKLESHLFGQLRERVKSSLGEIKTFASCASELDVFFALSESAVRYEFSRPRVNSGDLLKVEEGRHPAVERFLPAGTFVPNDLELGGSDGRVIILTGPNMSGKSVYLRQSAVVVILAQIGSFVPARAAEVGVVDRIMTRIGAQDRMARGESTFMVEMRETSAIMRLATPKSLILLDEVGRGTSTFDGISIAWAVVEHLYKPEGGPKVLFATHYFELTELAEKFAGIKNCNIAVKEWTNALGKTEVVFLHKIASGPADKSYGIHVAQLAGLPESALARAREILHVLETKGDIRVESGDENQTPMLPIFSGHPVIDELKMCDADNMTPLQALSAITDWKKRLKD